MKLFSGGAKRGVVSFRKRLFTGALVLALLLQPMGTPLLLGVFLLSPAPAIAQETDPGTEQSSSDEGGDAEDQEESQDPAEEEGVTEEPVIEETIEPTQEVPSEESEGDSITEKSATTKESSDHTKEEAPKTVCLRENEGIKKSSEADWETQEGGKIAETKEKVKLGVRYAFPGHDDVSVTFTCLPSDESKLDTLKITQVDTGDLNLPVGVIVAAEYAYDITTGMDNGDFKYDLELPKIASGEFDISYIEKNLEEVRESGVKKSDVKKVDGNQIENTDFFVEATDLDHFTIFVVVNPAPTGAACITAGATSGTDCYDTIQGAINAATGTGNTIKIKNGTYTESLIISNKQDLTLEGESQAGVVIKTAATWGVSVDGGSTNVTFKDLTIEDVAAVSGYHIKVYDSEGITFDTVDLVGNGLVGRGGLDFNSVSKINLDTVSIKNYKKNGLAFTASCNTSSRITADISIQDVSIENVAWSGIAFYTKGGPSCGSTEENIEGVTFSGINTVKSIGQFGVNLEASASSSVSGPGGDRLELRDFVFEAPIGAFMRNLQEEDVDATEADFNGQQDPNAIEVGIWHDCAASPYIHGTCDVFDIADSNYGSVEYLKKIDICHATASQNNPYTSNNISVSSVNNQCVLGNGHGNSNHSGDIVPPFSVGTSCTYAGQNWTSENQALWASQCGEEVEPVCGDGEVNRNTESCDYGSLNGNSTCSKTCTWQEPVCSLEPSSVTNGEFEIPDVTNGAGWDIFDNAQVPGWVAEWVGADVEGRPDPKIEIHGGVNGWNVGHNQYVELDSDWGGPSSSQSGEAASIALSQTIPTIVGKEYTITFDYAPRPSHGNNRLEVKIDGGMEFDTGNIAGAGGNPSWVTESVTFTATNAFTELRFTELGNADSLGMFLDNIRIACDEPGQSGTLTIRKVTDPAGSPQSFSFDPSWSEDDFSLTDGQEEVVSLPVGTYSVSENPLTGWRLDEVTCSDGSSPEEITLEENESVICIFKNQQTARIVATKIVCTDEADLPNYGELGGPNITATTAQNWVATHESCSFQEDWQFQWAYQSTANAGDNTGESLNPDWHTFGPTGVNGETSTNLDLKSSALFWVREVYQDEYIPFSYDGSQANPNSNDVSAEMYCHTDVLNYDNYDFVDASGNFPSYYCVAWNSPKKSTLHIQKVIIGDQQATPDEFTFQVNEGETTAFEADGENDLPVDPGTYSITEPSVAGYTTSYENCSGIELALGEEATCTITNTKNISVTASKIVCTDESDLPNYGEPGGPNITATTAQEWVNEHESCTLVPDWQFQWSQDNVGNPGDNTGEALGAWTTFGPTESNGTAAVSLPGSGLTSRLWFREIWDDQYIPFSNDEFPDNTNDFSAEFYCDTDVVNYDNWDWIDVQPGGEYHCVAWNVLNPGEIIIEKFNDSVGPETPGNTVEYTLLVRALDNFVNDVTVTDLPPEGFEYEEGSANGVSDDAGHVGPIELSHEYASPGIWSLGDMKAGETITLKYKTRIADSQDDGTYDDLAFARGVNGIGGDILATDPGDADNFVGTLVAVATPVTNPNIDIDTDNRTETDTDHITQYVLGASTLPATGANTKVVLAALALLVAGLGLFFWDRRKSKMLALSVLIFGGSFAASQASAASLAVEIEEPEALVRGADFKIGYVTLNLDAGAVTVKCYKVGEGTAFQTDDLASGGNSGDCQVNSMVMPVDGDYQFYVTAQAGEGAPVASDTVNVKLISTNPGTPHNYDRDQATCDDVITFTTANDGGKTVQVELYRSTQKHFVAETPVETLAIGSNQHGQIVTTPSDCQEDYWYAIRAVDTYGNGSGFVGDEDVDVDTDTDTETDTVVLGGTTTGGGALPVVNAAGGVQGQVEGATTQEGAPGDENGEVLGEMTEDRDEAGDSKVTSWIKNHKAASFILGAGILYSLYLIFGWYRNRVGKNV